MNVRRTAMCLPLLGVLAIGVGCAADNDGRDADTTEDAAQEIVSEGPEAKHGRVRGRRGPPGGPEFLLVAALHELELTDAQQRTIEDALDEARSAHRADGHDAVGAALAAGVRAGKVDVDAVLAKVPADAPERHAALATALQTLHSTLTKEQRRVLIAAVTDKIAHRAPPGGPREEGRGAPPPPPDGREHREHGPMGHLLRDLDLTDAQRASIDQALSASRPAKDDPEIMRKRMEERKSATITRLATFATDTFDAKAFVAPPADAAGGPKGHLERLARDLAAITPVLQAEQRETLASRLEAGPPKMPDRGRRGRR